MERFSKLIRRGVEEGFSDIHITGGHPAVYRKNGVILFDTKNVWRHEEIDNLVDKILTPRDLHMLRMRFSADFARTFHNIRVRINVFNTSRGLSLAIRMLPGTAPRIDTLNLHPSLKEFCKLTSGLILICGATGSGKSTTIASMIEEINNNRPSHIITLEDPTEYRFVSKKAFIEQRELGTHIPSFEQGLIDVLREDPDVIVVGELREPETMRLTLNAVESGHLVIASLHATNSEDALYRICNSFPAEAQDMVRTQLSSTIAVLIVQKLIKTNDYGFRLPLLSIMIGTQSVKGIIRDNRMQQIEGTIQTGRGKGMFTMENYMKDFLANCKHIASPFDNFKPSEESSSEIIYQSSLIDNDAQLIYEKEMSSLPERKSKRDLGRRRTDYDQHHYVIDEDTTPMADLVAELSKLEHSKNKNDKGN